MQVPLKPGVEVVEIFPAPPAEPAGPEPLLRGRFSLYEKDGTMALFYRLDGQDQDVRLDIPPWAVAAAQQYVTTGERPGVLDMARAAFGRG